MLPKKAINDINNLSRIQWACRRGMLELDVLLGDFLKGAYPNLSIEDKQLFLNLLDYSDPELFDWLMGYVKPDNADLAKITECIRHYAQSRSRI